MADTTIPASSRGRAVATRIGFETAPGTIAPAWQPIRYYELSSGQERPLVRDDQLGAGLHNERDIGVRRQGLPGGSLRRVVPANLSEVGWWLSLGMGRAAATGAGDDFVHVFTSGAGPQNTATLLQKWASDVWTADLGVALASFTLRAAKAETPARFDLSLLSLGEWADDEAPAGTVATAYAASESFSDWRWRVLYDDVAVADCTGLDVTVDFGLEKVLGLSGDEWPSRFHAGDVTVSGSMDLYGRAEAIRSLGASGAADKLELVATHPDDPTNRLISLVMPAAQFAKPQRSVSGPGMMSTSTSFEAGQTDAAAALAITLKNSVSSYVPA